MFFGNMTIVTFGGFTSCSTLALNAGDAGELRPSLAENDAKSAVEADDRRREHSPALEVELSQLVARHVHVIKLYFVKLLRTLTLRSSSPSASVGVSAMKAQCSKRGSFKSQRKGSMPMFP